MELREWLIILGLVLVATIVIDGFRRLQRQRRVPRLDRATGESGTDAGSETDPEEAAREAEINWELPNGGARVVRPATFERSGSGSEPVRPSAPKRQERIPDEELQRSVLNRKSRSSFAGMQKNVKSAMRAGAKRVSESAQWLNHKRDEPERGGEEDRAPQAARRDTPAAGYETPVANHEEPKPSSRQPLGETRVEPRVEADAVPEGLQITTLTPHEEDDWAPQAESEAHGAADPGYVEPSSTESVAQVESEVPVEEPAPRHDVVTQHPAVERAKRHHVSAARARETLAHAEEVIVISVLARTEDGFDGTTLLNLMLACGLRFSEMGIFHRYETESSDSELQFSMVNVLKPGVFDLDNMQNIVTPGVTFLMPLPGANDTSAAFEAMLETAMVLVRNLGGELKDENHSVMTAQTIEFARQRVQEFERRHRLHRYQAN